MPKFDSKAESQTFELISGDYRFEVVAVDNAISQGAKTRGCDVREVKLKFYQDEAFTKPIAQWTEDFIAADNCVWKWSVFAKCVGFSLADGQEFDIDHAWIGRRGWATCRPEEDKDKTKIDPQTGHTKKYNRVSVFITNKGMLPPNPQAKQPEADEPLPF